MRRFHASQGRWPRLFGRGGLNDRITRRMLFSRDPRWRICCDKLAMRAFAAERLGEDLAPPLLAVAETAADLPWDSLAGPFMLKASHGSGWARPVPDPARADRAALAAEASGWLAQDYAGISLEWAYRGLPRRLLAERLLRTADGGPPIDWRLHCFAGRVGLLAPSLRAPAGGLLHAPMLPDGTAVPFYNRRTTGRLELPAVELPAMLRIAERLSAGFDYIRVDLYWEEGRAWLGELTPYQDGGRAEYSDPRWDAWLGALWAAGGGAWPPPPRA